MAFFKEIAHEIASEIENRPTIYKAVGSLTIALESIKKKPAFKDFVDPMAQLHAKLKNAMSNFNSNTAVNTSLIKYQTHLQTFAEECHSAIYAYQPTLMSAPGLWNQLKARINNFLEHYFALNPVFDTTLSKLGLQGNFSKKFNQVKNELKPQTNDDEPCCITSCTLK